MGYALVAYMNNTPIFQEILNAVSRNLDVEQVYLTFSPASMDIKKKLFSKAQFKFSYGANAKNSDNTGIKFSMSK
jgi:D-ribose pyranose/furanose isomerase RbsD